MEKPSADRAMIELMAGRIAADEALDAVLAVLHSTEDPDFDLIREVGCGALESIFHQGYEELLWPRLEQLARDDERFRRALSSVWAYESPMFERRDALLEELGEFRNVAVHFVVEPRTFDESDGFDWRAIDVQGMPERLHLAEILREIADLLERPVVKETPPPPPPRPVTMAPQNIEAKPTDPL